MISLMMALVMTTAQEQPPVPPEPAQVAEVKAQEPEKVCKKRFVDTGQGITGLKTRKVCKTKEEWDRLKSNR